MSVTSQMQRFIEKSAIAEIFDKSMEVDMAYEFLSASHNYVSPMVEDYKFAKEYALVDREYSFSYKSVDEFFGFLAAFLAGGGRLIDAAEYLRTVTCLDEINSQRVIDEFRKEL